LTEYHKNMELGVVVFWTKRASFFHSFFASLFIYLYFLFIFYLLITNQMCCVISIIKNTVEQKDVNSD